MIAALLLAAVEALESDPDLAVRARRALGIEPGDEWLSLPRAGEIAGGIDPRVIADDARRGRITLGHAGRTPVVRRTELDRWLSARPAKVASEPTSGETKAAGIAVLESAARRLRRSA